MNVNKFDYLEDVKNSVIDFLNDNDDLVNIEDFAGNRQGIVDTIMSEYAMEDCLTGLASHSYTNETAQSYKNLEWNFDLLAKAFESLPKEDIIEAIKNPDMADCQIRYYLLPQAIDLAVRELERERGIDLDSSYENSR